MSATDKGAVRGAGARRRDAHQMGSKCRRAGLLVVERFSGRDAECAGSSLPGYDEGGCDGATVTLRKREKSIAGGRRGGRRSGERSYSSLLLLLLTQPSKTPPQKNSRWATKSTSSGAGRRFGDSAGRREERLVNRHTRSTRLIDRLRIELEGGGECAMPIEDRYRCRGGVHGAVSVAAVIDISESPVSHNDV